MTPAKSIVVATDFSEIADNATAYAVDLARRLGAKVTFLHAYEIPVYSFFDGSLVATADLAASIASASAGSMEALLTKYKGSGVAVDGVVRVGPPAEEVQRVAEEVKAELIVVGTHGRRGLARALLGSVAEVVVRTSSRPVVVVPFPRT
jgi:nucleotide-binding universal stress UspA family protein